MTFNEAAEVFEYVKNGGGYCAPLLLIALLWMNAERKDLLAKLEAKSTKIESLAERTIVMLTELRGLLGHKGVRG